MDPDLGAHAQGFYTPPRNCQIPTFGFLYDLFFGHCAEGTFVEVGAYNGYDFSNTSCLADAGWKGFCIEPVPALARECEARYAPNDRVHVICTAIGDAVGELTLFVGGKFSTANLAARDEYRSLGWGERALAADESIVVPQTTLDRFLEDHHLAPGFEVLVVDVEGYEDRVFAGFDLRRWRPKMMIVELADTHPHLTSTRQEHARLSRLIADRGYVVAYKDLINTVFVTDELFDTAYGLSQ